MEKIGKQVRLPIKTAFSIAMQGIKIRLGRALVTISGVVLGIAFLMSILTGNIITNAVSKEQDFQNQLKVMMTATKGSMGVIKDKPLAVVVLGQVDDVEQAFLRQLLEEQPSLVRAYHFKDTGVTPTAVVKDTSDDAQLAGIADQCELLLILGKAGTCKTSFADLTRGMKQLAILDSNTKRTFANSQTAERDFFFGSKADEERAAKVEKEKAGHSRMLWIVTISLLVTIIGITNALLMSVTERFKEIGTMKCLGALSGFIRQLFLIESLFIGFVGSLAGILFGIIFPLAAYSCAYGLSLVMGSLNYGQLFGYCGMCLVAGCVLSIIAAIYPATIAARMIPAMALRSNV